MDQFSGWIALHRKFTSWEWYSDPATKVVFLHLLLLARWNDGNWKGEPLKRGQVIIGRRSLAKTLGLSEQQVRSALRHLISTREITLTATHRYSIVTINNFNAYQNIDAAEVTHSSTHSSTQHQPQLNNITNNSNKNTLYISEIVAYLNQKTGKNYRVTGKVKEAIRQLVDSGYMVDDIKRVIDKKADDWLGTKYEPGLAPRSLFELDKFDSYLNESRVAQEKNDTRMLELLGLQIRWNEEGLSPQEEKKMRELERELYGD